MRTGVQLTEAIQQNSCGHKVDRGQLVDLIQPVIGGQEKGGTVSQENNDWLSE